jgi:hypothetical protein
MAEQLSRRERRRPQGDPVLARRGRCGGRTVGAPASARRIRGAHGDRNRASARATTTPAQELRKGAQKGREEEGREKGGGNEAAILEEDQERVEEQEGEDAGAVRSAPPSHAVARGGQQRDQCDDGATRAGVVLTKQIIDLGLRAEVHQLFLRFKV